MYLNLRLQVAVYVELCCYVFQTTLTIAPLIRSLQGPVYDADRDHHFKALVVHAHELKNLQGPVYDTGADRAHQFQQGPDST